MELWPVGEGAAPLAVAPVESFALVDNFDVVRVWFEGAGWGGE